MNCANHPDRERVAFCQNCGKPLCSECMRTVGSAVFCEPCLAARLAAADAAASQTTASGTPYGYVNVPPLATAPAVPGAPNPLIAGGLGFIPGVGAMYNGQYAKGVVHLVVFAVLASLAESNGAFGILVAGWIFYQVFEAYHTARARHDGTPLPNPFGLNDIGEKLGFGKGWTQASPGVATAVSPASTVATHFQDASGNVFYSSGDGTTFTQSASGAQAFVAPPAPPPSTGWSSPTSSYAYTAPPIPTSPYYSAPSSPADIFPPTGGSNFPVGALLLIVLGLLFFFGSSGWFRGFPVQRIIPFLLIGTGVWVFYQRMTRSGQRLTDDGTPGYQIRLFYAARRSVWIILVGVLFFLDTFNILSWGHSWPLFIILSGVMTFLQRSMTNAPGPLPYGYPVPPTPTAPAAPSPDAAVTAPLTEEGR